MVRACALIKFVPYSYHVYLYLIRTWTDTVRGRYEFIIGLCLRTTFVPWQSYPGRTRVSHIVYGTNKARMDLPFVLYSSIICVRAVFVPYQFMYESGTNTEQTHIVVPFSYLMLSGTTFVLGSYQNTVRIHTVRTRYERASWWYEQGTSTCFWSLFVPCSYMDRYTCSTHPMYVSPVRKQYTGQKMARNVWVRAPHSYHLRTTVVPHSYHGSVFVPRSYHTCSCRVRTT